MPSKEEGLPPLDRKRPRKSGKADLESRLEKVEGKLVSKGAVGYFVPCTRLREVLIDAGVSQQSAEAARMTGLTLEKLVEDVEE